MARAAVLGRLSVASTGPAGTGPDTNRPPGEVGDERSSAAAADASTAPRPSSPVGIPWRVAMVAALRDETSTARTLVLDVPGWPGHLAGQHVDVRLTAPDGYRAVRSYSLASVAAGERIEITVEPIVDGEVSPYLAQVASVGDPLEVRGPIGGWFTWRPSQVESVQLVAGGSGVVPLMAMIRGQSASGNGEPFRLLYSARRPDLVIYRDELTSRAAAGLPVTYAYTRQVPSGWSRPPGRIDAELLAMSTFAADVMPTCYICGPTAFVEAAADLFLAAGHQPSRVRTERFGGP
jgi:ferredoxin-NADP reductase